MLKIDVASQRIITFKYIFHIIYLKIYWEILVINS